MGTENNPASGDKKWGADQDDRHHWKIFVGSIGGLGDSIIGTELMIMLDQYTPKVAWAPVNLIVGLGAGMLCVPNCYGCARHRLWRHYIPEGTAAQPKYLGISG